MPDTNSPRPAADARGMPPPAAARRPRALLLALLVAAGFAALGWVMFLHGLSALGLVGPDEPRYAEIGAEMLAAKNFVTPKLLGAPWLQKPVLEYWLVAAGDAVEGVNAAGSRLPNALLGLLLAAALAGFAAALRGWRAAGWTAAIALTSVFLFGFARAATTDMPLAAMMSFSLLCLYLWLRPQITGGGAGSRAWLWPAAAFLGFAVLAKGPVAMVLEGLVLVFMALRCRRWDWLRRVLTPGAITVFAVVTLPWYIAVSMRTPAFLKVFFWQNNLERFATNRYQHPQPVWFFLPILFLAVFPWSGWSLLPLANAFHRITGRNRGGVRAQASLPADGLLWFLWLWLIAVAGFFSLSQSKLPGYVLPAIPAAILLIAFAAGEEATPRWPGLISAAFTAAIPVGILLFPWLFTPQSWRPPAQYFLRNPALWMAGLGTAVVLWLLLWRRRFAAYIALTCAILAAAAWSLTGALSPQVNAIASARPLAAAVWAQCGPPATVRLPILDPRQASAPMASGSCAGQNLYAFQLPREMTYGLGFYLHRRPLPLAAQARWPHAGLVATDRRRIPALVNAALRHGLDACIVIAPPLGANWALLRLAAPPEVTPPRTPLGQSPSRRSPPHNEAKPPAAAPEPPTMHPPDVH